MINYIVQLFREYRKENSIGNYVVKLGPLLGRRYGKQKTCTATQVEEAAAVAGLRLEELSYGIGLYCSPEEFSFFYAVVDGNLDYWKLRAELADYYLIDVLALRPLA